VRARLVPTARGARRGARPPGFDRRAPRAVVRRRSPRRYPHAARRRPARADPRGLPPDGSRRAPARVAREGSMPQGTIKDFEGEERMGSLLMDDRTEVAIDAVSVEGSGLRSLRIGQRVRFDLVDEAGRKGARNLQIVTLSRGGTTSDGSRTPSAWRGRVGAWTRPSRGTPCRRGTTAGGARGRRGAALAFAGGARAPLFAP